MNVDERSQARNEMRIQENSQKITYYHLRDSKVSDFGSHGCISGFQQPVVQSVVGENVQYTLRHTNTHVCQVDTVQRSRMKPVCLSRRSQNAQHARMNFERNTLTHKCGLSGDTLHSLWLCVGILKPPLAITYLPLHQVLFVVCVVHMHMHIGSVSK